MVVAADTVVDARAKSFGALVCEPLAAGFPHVTHGRAHAGVGEKVRQPVPIVGCSFRCRVGAVSPVETRVKVSQHINII